MKCEQKGWCYLFTPLPAKVTSEATGLEQGFTNSTAHVRHLGSQENAGSGCEVGPVESASQQTTGRCCAR
jgi:hypothetical protein